MADIHRRKSVTGSIGGVRIGSDAPVVVQSMTNTDTADIPSTVKQVAALARAGSELVRVTVNNEEAAAAVAPIVEQLDEQGVRVPIIGDFHYNGHILLKKYPECARALAKYRINPGNVGIGRKDDDNFRTMIEVAVENQKPVRIGVNWGSLDQALLTTMMDENSLLPEPKDAREVTMEAMVVSALNSASAGGEIRTAARPDYPERQSQRRAGPDRRLPLAGRALQLSAAPRADRSRHGRQRHRGVERRAGRAAAGRHRRHHPRLAHARARRRSHRRSPRRPADSAVARHSQLHAAGDRVPGLRPHHQHVLPGNGASRFSPTCASRCRCGRDATPASKR